MQLTPHFADTEPGLTVLAGADPRVVENVVFLLTEILEPIRVRFGAVHVHDSFRDPRHNASVGGKATSFHMCAGGRAAVDIHVDGASIKELWDWLRLESGLKFDKVIMETNAAGVPACVHIQIDRLSPPRRQAYTGRTGNGSVYIPAEVR